MNPHRCPIYLNDFEQIRQYLLDLPIHDLIFMTGLIVDELSPIERIHFDVNKFCCSFDDRYGRIQFIETLISQGIIQPLQVPMSYEDDPRITDLYRPRHFEFYFPATQAEDEQQSQSQEEEEATVPVQEQALSVRNPRWEHVDERKRQNSAQKASIGDEITLKVDITGFGEGARMIFDIFDVSENPPLRIDTVNGTHSKGVGSATWRVNDPNGKGMELQLEFEGSARSMASPRAPITIGMREFTFSF